MDEKKPNRYGLILAVAGFAAIATAFGLWLSGNSPTSTTSHNLSYADICADPNKLGLPTKDEPLPEHILSVIEEAEGDNAARMVARAALTNPPRQMGNTEWHIRFALTTLRYRFMAEHRSLITFVANCSYFGRDSVGVSEAAQTFFGKPVSKITASETALLAGLLKGPSSYDPVNHPERARQRRDTILEKMLAAGKITAADMIIAKLEPVTPAQAGAQ